MTRQYTGAFRRLCAALAVLSFCGAIAGCGPKAPILELEAETYDMGQIPTRGLSKGQVLIYNRGNAPLQIAHIQTGCGCTSTKMTKRFIPPGESSPLEITIDPAKVTSASSTQTVTIRSNDPTRPSVQLFVSSELLQDAVVRPAQFIGGQVEQGKGATAQLRVVQNTETPLVLKEMKLSGSAGFFECAYQELPQDQWADPNRREYGLISKLSPTVRPGAIEAEITLLYEDASVPPIKIPIKVDVLPVYTIEPRDLLVPSAERGAALDDVVRIVGTVPIEIVNVQNTHAALELSLGPTGEENVIGLDVAIAEEVPESVLRDTWTITVRANGQEFREDISVAITLAEEAG